MVEPGWYQDPTGELRWWDGDQWGVTASAMSPATTQTPAAPATTTDPRQMAMLAQILGAFAGWIGPLIIFLINGDKDPFVRHHAAEALNFHLTVLIAYLVCIPLMFVLVGFLLLPIIIVGALVMSIIAAMAANRGEWYRFPMSIRFVSGAVGG